jgi:hypothetical protein
VSSVNLRVQLVLILLRHVHLVFQIVVIHFYIKIYLSAIVHVQLILPYNQVHSVIIVIVAVRLAQVQLINVLPVNHI